MSFYLLFRRLVYKHQAFNYRLLGTTNGREGVGNGSLEELA
jgi:hypothetical protein